MGGSHEGSDEGKEVSDETGSNSISSIGDDDDAFLPDEQSSSFFNFFDDE